MERQERLGLVVSQVKQALPVKLVFQDHWGPRVLQETRETREPQGLLVLMGPQGLLGRLGLQGPLVL